MILQKKLAVRLILLGLASGLAGCGTGKSEFGCALPGGYKMVRNATMRVQIIPQAPDDIRPGVAANVVEIACDGHTIVAKRQPVATESELRVETDEKSLDAPFEYWVLDTDQAATYGPLTEHDFLVRENKFPGSRLAR